MAQFQTEENIGFFERTGNRLKEHQQNRYSNAAWLYNRFGMPSEQYQLNAENVHLFNPYIRRKFYGFQNWSDCGNDVRSLVLKPVIWIALAVYEMVNFWMSLLSVGIQLLTLNFSGALDKVVDAAEAYIMDMVCEFSCFIEFTLQIGSFFIRTGYSIAEACGVSAKPVTVSATGEDETRAFAGPGRRLGGTTPDDTDTKAQHNAQSSEGTEDTVSFAPTVVRR